MKNAFFDHIERRRARKTRTAALLLGILAAACLFAYGCASRDGKRESGGTPAGETAVTTDVTVVLPTDVTDITDVPDATPAGATDIPSPDPTERAAEKPTEPASEAPSGTPAEHATEKASGQPAGDPTGTPAEKPTEQPTEQPTGKPAENPTERPTENPTERPTQKPTEKPTERSTPTPAPTQTLPEVDPADIEIKSAVPHGIKTQFSNMRNCTVSVVSDPDEGDVIAVTSANISSPGSAAATVYFKYASFCAAAGEKPVSMKDRPYLLLKVKSGGMANRTVGVIAASSLNDSEANRPEVFATIDGGDGWKYVCFDLGEGVKNIDPSMLRIVAGQYADAAGESLLISRIAFLTAEEAKPYLKSDTYGTGQPGGGGTDMRVLQFNIQTENGSSTPFRLRAEMYRELIDELQPDIVGMQEVTVSWFRWLDSRVFNDSYARIGEPRTPGGEANPIYYRKDKFDLVDGGTFWLSDTPDVQGSSFPNGNYPRICTWAVLRERSTGREFVHLNTHLDHNGKNNSTDGNNLRKDQIRVIIRFAERFKGMPTFLTGDLNNRRTTSGGNLYALYKMIVGKTAVELENGESYKLKLADSRLESPVTVDENHLATMTVQYDESSASYNPGKEPIDYIFFDPESTDPHTYETFLISKGAYEISDHLPVFATFTIRK